MHTYTYMNIHIPSFVLIASSGVPVQHRGCFAMNACVHGARSWSLAYVATP